MRSSVTGECQSVSQSRLEMRDDKIRGVETHGERGRSREGELDKPHAPVERVQTDSDGGATLASCQNCFLQPNLCLPGAINYYYD